MAAPLVAALRASGWDVVYVAELDAGIDDGSVLRKAFAENRVLLTTDKDFGELIFRLRLEARGVLMLRLPAGRWPQHWDRLRDVLVQHADRLDGNFTVVSTDKVRFRSLQALHQGHSPSGTG